MYSAYYEGLTSDPLAGPSTNIPSSYFGGGGIDTGGLGITSGGQYYGGDGSGSFLDYFSRFVYETDQFNPIALIWDGIKGNVSGSDRYGNTLSGFDANLKIVSAIPVTKAASIVTNSVGRVVFSQARIAAKTSTRVFWSGGNVAKNSAASFAKSNGMKTLEMTTRGRVMNTLNSVLPRSVSSPIWRSLSTNFSKGAIGQAHFFTTPLGPHSGSIWLNIEKPILQQNGVRIITH